MHEIDIEQAQSVGGGFSLGNWVISQVFTAGARFAWNATISGQVDYSGVAESQGSYYNMVGA